MLKDRMRADLKVYRDALRMLDVAVLKHGTGMGFKETAKNAEIAQRSFEAASERLNQHIASHGCKQPIPD